MLGAYHNCSRVFNLIHTQPSEMDGGYLTLKSRNLRMKTFFFIYFIYLREKERVHVLEGEGESSEADPMQSIEPNMVLDPTTLRS